MDTLSCWGYIKHHQCLSYLCEYLCTGSLGARESCFIAVCDHGILYDMLLASPHTLVTEQCS